MSPFKGFEDTVELETGVSGVGWLCHCRCGGDGTLPDGGSAFELLPFELLII